jgi:AAA domain
MTDIEPDSLLSGVVTAAELSHKVFPDLAEFVSGIVVEGLGIVAGPPKLGKSWFTLSIALAVSAGGHAFGKLKCEPRPVLLLALEDSERRLQTRIKAVWGSDIPPHRLHLLTSIGPGLLIPTIAEWLMVHSDGLVILDTLGRARQQRRPGADAYLEDYQAGVALKNVVDGQRLSSISSVASDMGSNGTASKEHNPEELPCCGFLVAAPLLVFVDRHRAAVADSAGGPIR